MRSLLAAALCCCAAVPISVSASAAELPARMTERGTMVVAVVPNYPPLEFRDPATGALAGFDVELGEALARKLGVRIAWQETSFDQMLASLGTGRVDAVLSGMSDLASRHGAAAFVDYLRSGPQFFVPAARAAAFGTAADLCGKSVGTSRRTSFPKEIADWSGAHCPAADPVRVVGTEGSADARAQLRQGRIDAAVQGSETLPFIMEQEPGAYAPVGAPISSQLMGLALPVGETGLQQAVAQALDALIADGAYGALLAKWRLTGNALDKATINAGR